VVKSQSGKILPPARYLLPIIEVVSHIQEKWIPLIWTKGTKMEDGLPEDIDRLLILYPYKEIAALTLHTRRRLLIGFAKRSL
jgi:hypothetical protein